MRLLLVDDHKMMLDALRAVLVRAEITDVHDASNGHDAIEVALRVRPDVVLMDVAMPVLNGIVATRRLVAELPGIKIIGLSMSSDRRYVVEMLRAGAVGYLLKNCAADELLESVREVSSGRRYLSPTIAAVAVDDAIATASGSRSSLSTREREVLQLLAEGHTSKAIAARLSLGVATVETHRRNIMGKLDIHSLAELTKFAVREGLTSIE